MDELAEVQAVYLRLIQKKTVGQGGTDEVMLLFCQRPGCKLLVLFAPCVAVVEDVAQRQLVAAVIYKRDALGALADTAVEALIPVIEGIAGRGSRALGVDQELVGEAETEIPGCGAQKVRPFAA